MDTVFSASGLLALPFWAAMILLPTFRWTQRVIASPLIIAGAAALYVALVVPRLLEILPAVASPTLAGVARLLGTADGATIAWVHFLAFDLFVGRWIYLDSRARALHPLVIGPVLLLTLLLGPLGFLAYVVVRALPTLNISTTHARRLWTVDPVLALVAIGSTLLFVGTLVGLAADPRIITGSPAWLKPMKFAVSIGIYSVTFLWLLGQVEGHRRLVRISGTVTGVTATIELVIIVGQVIRGTTSHFNYATPLDAALFGIMGTSIVVLWMMGLVLGVLLLRQRFSDPAFAWGLRLAVLLSLCGMGLAFLMTNPNADQRATLAATGAAATIGAHSVGVPDGGPGLPILGWSTIGGDLRAPHFVGIHALQVLPLVGFFLSRPGLKRGRGRFGLDARHRSALVCLAGGFYGALIAVLTWQALRGQPISAPDGQTLAAFGGLILATVVLAAAIVAHGTRMTSREDMPAAPVAAMG